MAKCVLPSKSARTLTSPPTNDAAGKVTPLLPPFVGNCDKCTPTIFFTASPVMPPCVTTVKFSRTKCAWRYANTSSTLNFFKFSA